MTEAAAGDVSPSPLFAYLYRLRLIGRWGLMRSSIPENVAEHTYQVALVTHALGTIAREVFGRTDVPVERAVVLALFHDATEVVTGDIPTPVKHHNPRVLESLRELEALAADQLERRPQRHCATPIVRSSRRRRTMRKRGTG